MDVTRTLTGNDERSSRINAEDDQMSIARSQSTPSSSPSKVCQKRTRDISLEDREVVQSDESSGGIISNHPWKGWAELENDPLIFTQLIRDWGVSDVQVNEVIPLEAIFEKVPNDVLGLIFLSRWTPAENDNSILDPPEELWYANQVSTFSCATLALMNIINNQPRVDLGEQLSAFKKRTMSMTSKDRGFALDNFQFVKDIHNSFSREIDHLVVDLRLKEDVQAAARKRAPKKKKRKKRKKFSQDDDDNGFHFIAYIPLCGHVWKLDGTEPQPRRLANYDDTDNWLLASVADIQAQMQDPQASAMEFSCLSVTRESTLQTNADDEARVQRMKEDWSPFIVHMLKLHAEKGDIETLL